MDNLDFFDDLLSEEAKREIRLQALKRSTNIEKREWKDGYIADEDGRPRKFHIPQQIAWDTQRRTIAMLAGSQGGKTSYGPWWLEKEIRNRGSGDYLAVTATYDLFKLKMLPMMMLVFCDILKIGRYWAGDRIIEIRDPQTGTFSAQKSTDPMWARIVLRSADALGGLESATAKAAWLDEAGQDKFTYSAYKAIRRRLSLKKGRILITTTLYSIGWLDQYIMEKTMESGVYSVHKENEGEIEVYDSEDQDTCLIQFDSIVNPLFPKSEYDEMRAKMAEDEFAMFYRGRKATRRFLIYDVFDPRIDTCPRFTVPEHWVRYLGMDFGGTHTCGVFYAEHPDTLKLYAYREYLGGHIPIKEHTAILLQDEIGVPYSCGGAPSENVWRAEFAQYGLFIDIPSVPDVDLQINRVYACHKKHEIIYFNDLYGILDQKSRYRRKRDDKTGELMEEIENKSTFHYIDAERYIISQVRPGENTRAKVIMLGG